MEDAETIREISRLLREGDAQMTAEARRSIADVLRPLAGNGPSAKELLASMPEEITLERSREYPRDIDLDTP